MSDSEEPKKRIMPSPATMDLMLGMGRDRAFRVADQGMAAVEASSSQWKTTADLWLSVDKRLPEISAELYARLGVDRNAVQADLERADCQQEPCAERPKVPESFQTLRERHDLISERSVMSQVIKDAKVSQGQGAGQG